MKRKRQNRFLPGMALGYPFAALIAWHLASPVMAAGGATDAAASSSGLVQVVLGLGLVLAVMAGCTWLLKRLGGMRGGHSGVIKIIGSSAVGQRERVIVVEVADTWLVIGVAPGHVTALHSMPKGEAGASIANIASIGGYGEKDSHFSGWLKRVVEKRGEQRVR